MTTSRLSEALHRLCGKIQRNNAELNDGQLLESYVVGHEAAALEALVGRHGPMVWGVCRRILPNHHDAEDAFQAAFLVLVRKASSIQPRTMVGNWLFGVARQTALKARATTAKRRLREQPMTAQVERAVAPADLSNELSQVLDDELARLPDKYRAVLILCGLQGKPLKEAARRLGLPEGTAASRLARGRDMLAKHMIHRGLAFSGVSLATLQLHQAAAGAPPAAVSAVIKAATGATAKIASANVAALTNGVVKAMLITKLMKATAAALLILCVLGAGAMGWAEMKQEAQPPASPTKQEAKKDKAPEQKADVAKDDNEKDDPNIRYQVFTVSGKAVDPDGKPVAGATIYLVSTNNSPQRLLGTATSDKDGQYAFKDAKLPYPVTKRDDVREQGSFEVFGKCSGRAFAWGGVKFLLIDPRFKKDASDPRILHSFLPAKTSYFPDEEVEINLMFAAPKKVEGRIVDEKGQPITGVKLRMIACDYVNTAGMEQSTNAREFWGMKQAADVMPDQICAATDAKGRFEFSSVPSDVFCLLLLQHPGYADSSLYTSTAENPPGTHDEGHPVLKLPLKLTLYSVRTIHVQVRSKEDNKPLAGIWVSGYQQRASGSSSNGVSDKDGKVTLKLPPGQYRLLGEPPSEWTGKSVCVRTYEDLVVEEAPAEQSIILLQQKGCILILKAIDAATGKGVPKVAFWYEAEIGGRQAHIRVQSGADYIDNPLTNDKGELRAVVYAGERRYGLNMNLMPDGYEIDDPKDSDGRQVELPTGTTVTETFKLRKKK